MDNVVVLPHVGSATARTRAAMTALTLRNLDEYLDPGHSHYPGGGADELTRRDRRSSAAGIVQSATVRPP